MQISYLTNVTIGFNEKVLRLNFESVGFANLRQLRISVRLLTITVFTVSAIAYWGRGLWRRGLSIAVTLLSDLTRNGIDDDLADLQTPRSLAFVCDKLKVNHDRLQ